MINRIKINNIPPYLGEEQAIEAKHVNFLFGLNGSGKTTISKFLRSPLLPLYSDCSVEWEDAPIKCEVYNRDYVRENFSESAIPGIFTLGEENIEIQGRIEVLTARIKDLGEQQTSAENKLNGTDNGVGLKAKLQALGTTYTEKFWAMKQQLDKEHSPLQLAIEGFRGSKESFKRKIISEYRTNNSELLERAELERLCTQLFASNKEKASLLSVPSFDKLISFGENELLQRVIVGKEDVAIAGLIKKLGSDGWFRQGVPYLEESNGLCPFCQRPLDQEFLDQVEEYFDETYLSALNDIGRLCDDYTLVADALVNNLTAMAEKPSVFLKTSDLKIAVLQLKSVVENNKKKLSNKRTSPNTIVQLEPIHAIAETIAQLFTEANAAIVTYNERIDHIKDEKEALISKVWKYIIHAQQNDIEAYLKEETELKQAIEATQAEIQALGKEIADESQKRRSLEQRLTSVVPTANGINALLQNYGVTGFSLRVNDSENSYQFVRENGTPAYESLSEGERNFVTFLYFMYSLKGNRDESGHNDDKVVVIDDPVSSLDNDVLFLVSSLIRDLFKDIYAGTGTIKQIFILSHNSYFYKEVSYKQGIDKKKTGYWMITKSNNISKITGYKENPVSSTYEMLWDEVKAASSAPSECNSITLANTMRRIIEHYFNLLGGIDLSKFHLDFPDGERQVFKSLISWANAGSHSAFDDYSATPHIYNTETYLKVFRDLFVKTKHIAHYDMMMKMDTEAKNDGQAENAQP